MLRPTTVPVSDLRSKHREIFGLLKDGPILLAVRSRAEAVLVDVDYWNKMVKRLTKFEQEQKTAQMFAEMRHSDLPLYTFDELEAIVDADSA